MLSAGGLAELALWRGHPDQAKQCWSTRRCPRWRPTSATPRRSAPACVSEADIAERPGPSPPPAGPRRPQATTSLDRLTGPPPAEPAPACRCGSAWYAPAGAEQTNRASDLAAWAAAAAAWEQLGQPYRTAYAGFRHAEALLAPAATATPPRRCCGAAEVTGRLGA